MAKKETGQFQIEVHGKTVQVDVSDSGIFHEVGDNHHGARSLAGLKKMLEDSNLPEEVPGIPVQDEEGRTGTVKGRMPGEKDYYIVQWSNKKIESNVWSGSLMHVLSPEEKARFDKLKANVIQTEEAQNDAINAEAAFTDAHSMEKTLRKIFSRKK